MMTKSYHTIESLGIKAQERKASERKGPRFAVIADGECKLINTTRALTRLLDVIYAPSPLVFVNADNGITIDFDRSCA